MPRGIPHAVGEPLTVVGGSLFSGAGFMDLAFERAGCEIAWQVEIDKDARSVLRRHWPDRERFEDVRHVGRHNLRPVDLIFGGFPCQDLSAAGRRSGLAGKRSNLFFEYCRIVDELRPSLVLIENVPGLLSSNARRDFGTILATLRDIGPCDIGWRVLDAQYAGVPQRRRRVFIVVDFREGASAAEVLFESSCSYRNPPPRRKARPGIAAAPHGGTPSGGIDVVGGAVAALTADGVGTCGADDNQAQAGHLIAEEEPIPISEAGARQGVHFDLKDGTGVGDHGDPMFTLQAGHPHGVATAVNTGHGWWTESDVSHTLTHRDFKDAQTLVAEPATTHALTSEGADASEDGTGRGTPLVVAEEPWVFEARVARNGRGSPSAIVPPLKAQSGQSGKGDAAPLVVEPMAFDTAQITSNVNGTRAEPGLPASTLAGRSRMHVAIGGEAQEGAVVWGVRRLTPL